MGLFLLILGVVIIISLFLMTLAGKQYFVLGVILPVGAFLIGLIVLPQSPPLTANYEAIIYGLYGNANNSQTIDFENYTQVDGVVTIKGYYVYGKIHWLDFYNYEYVDKTLEIKVPEGKQFEYKLRREPVQIAIGEK